MGIPFWAESKKMDSFDPEDLPNPRRSPGLLSLDIDLICRDYVKGEISLPEGKYMTPYYLGKILKETDGLEQQPSTGAVAAILKRWEEQGYAVCRRNPHAFVSYTDLGHQLGFEKFFIRKNQQ